LLLLLVLLIAVDRKPIRRTPRVHTYRVRQPTAVEDNNDGEKKRNVVVVVAAAAVDLPERMMDPDVATIPRPRSIPVCFSLVEIFVGCCIPGRGDPNNRCLCLTTTNAANRSLHHLRSHSCCVVVVVAVVVAGDWYSWNRKWRFFFLLLVLDAFRSVARWNPPADTPVRTEPADRPVAKGLRDRPERLR